MLRTRRSKGTRTSRERSVLWSLPVPEQRQLLALVTSIITSRLGIVRNFAALPVCHTASQGHTKCAASSNASQLLRRCEADCRYTRYVGVHTCPRFGKLDTFAPTSKPRQTAPTSTSSRLAQAWRRLHGCGSADVRCSNMFAMMLPWLEAAALSAGVPVAAALAQTPMTPGQFESCVHRDTCMHRVAAV